MAFWDKPETPSKYLERRGERFSQWEEIADELEYVLQNGSDAAIFECIKYYLPTAERLCNEHGNDSVSDHNLTVEQRSDVKDWESEIQELRHILNSLSSKGYR